MIKEYVTPNDTIRENDSASIQAAVDLAKSEGINKVIIPKQNIRTGEEKWIITETVKLPSDMTVILDNCFMQMADDVVGGFFKTETLFTEKGTDPKCKLKNIHIKGVGHPILDGGKPTAINEDTQRQIGIPVRLNSPIFFMNVDGFSVENVNIHHQRYWGMRFQFCSNGTVKDIHFDICRDRRNQDGINLRNGCHHITIENISGQTGDDMIALSAIDKEAAPPFEAYDVIVKGEPWDIHDVDIRNVSGAAVLHPLITMRNHNGAKIYNINIENVRDTAQTQPAYEEGNTPLHGEPYTPGRRFALVLLGHNAYVTKPAVMGDTYNITLKNLRAEYCDSVILTHSVMKDIKVSGVCASEKCKSILTVMGNEWGDDTLGVKIESFELENVVFDSERSDAAVIDYRYMRDGDYVKGMNISNLETKNVDILAKVHKRCTEFDLTLDSVCKCPDKIVRTEPQEVKQSEITYLPFKPNISRKYD